MKSPGAQCPADCVSVVVEPLMWPPRTSQAAMKAGLILILSWLCFSSGNADDDRIVVEGAKINGAPVRLYFDTAADRLILFSSAAERLGLKLSPVRGLWRQK